MMPRLAPVVAPGVPHHIVQRGSRRQRTFFCDDDYQTYGELMAEWCGAHRVEIWACCLMPNHVQRIAVPQSPDGLSRAIGKARRRYTRKSPSRPRTYRPAARRRGVSGEARTKARPSPEAAETSAEARTAGLTTTSADARELGMMSPELGP